MIASMAAFAIEDAFLKTVTKQLPVGQVLMMFGAAGLCVFALMARRAGASIFQAQVLTKNMLFRGVFEFFGRLFYVLAIALTPMSSATAILQSAPLFVVLGARIFLREKVDARTWIAIFTGLFGVMIILRPSAADFSLLSLLALIGTLGFVGRDYFRRATGCTHAFGLRYCDWRWAVYRLAKPASSTRSMITGSFSGRTTRMPCLLNIST